MMKSSFFSIMLVAVAATICQAQEWGTLKARFVLDGAAPVPKKSNITKDIEVCGRHNLTEETLIVNKENKGIKDVVVMLTLKPGTKAKVHPDYAKTEKADVILDNKNCRFDPHICIMRTTQKLVVTNSDPVGHNTKADFFTNTSFNDLIPSKGKITKTLEKNEASPALVACSIHPWMSGKLIVREDPYAAASDKDGNVVIANLPVGKHTFTIWQESCGYVLSGDVKGKKESWKKGRYDIEIKKGDNDLGEIKIPLAVLQKAK